MSPEPPEEPEEEGVPPDAAQEPAQLEAESPAPVEPDSEPEVDPEPEPGPEPDRAWEPEPPPPPPQPPAEPPPAIRPDRRPGGFGRFVRAVVVWTFVLVVVAPVGMTLIYRFVPPPLTILMVQRVFEGKGLDYRWRPIDRISPALVQAAIASEDAKFCEHHGFDFEAMEKAMEANKRRPGRLRGGSTISQQTAKNVFLWPGKGVTRYIRKGLEVYSTVLIETLWGKRRIMEVYLNVAEMGAGTYGAEAAAQRYFGIPASQLNRAQAARLVAILPNPLKYKAVGSGPYVSRRTRRIGAAAGTVRNDGLAACVGKLRPPTGRERQNVAPSARSEVHRRAAPPPPPVEPPVLEPVPAEPELVPADPPPAVETPAFKTTD